MLNFSDWSTLFPFPQHIQNQVIPTRNTSKETFTKLPEAQIQPRIEKSTSTSTANQPVYCNALSLDIDDEDEIQGMEKTGATKLAENDSRKILDRNRPKHHTLPEVPRRSEFEIQREIYQHQDLGVRPYSRGRERRDYDHDGHKKRKYGRYDEKYQRNHNENRYGHHRYFDDRYESKKFRHQGNSSTKRKY